jgi:hypothetical protein
MKQEEDRRTAQESADSIDKLVFAVDAQSKKDFSDDYYYYEVGFHHAVAPGCVAVPHRWAVIVSDRRLRLVCASCPAGSPCGKVLLGHHIRGDCRAFQSGCTCCTLCECRPLGERVGSFDVLDSRYCIEAWTSTNSSIDNESLAAP